MSKVYRDYNPNQQFLLPPSLRDWLPEDHLAVFVDDVVGSLDLSAIFASYEQGDGRGKPPYHPAMMVRLLLYAYCVGKPSSRKIERATFEEVPFRVLSANQHPDHASISEFRKRHLRPLAELFVQLLAMAREMGLVKLGHIALDGTKVKANASKHKAMSYGRATEAERLLEQQVAELLAAAEQADAAEDERYGKDNRGGELPPELRRRTDRLAKIRELKAALEQQALEQAEAKAGQVRDKLAERAAKEAETGRKTAGRKPNEPDPSQATPSPKAQRNFTDPESRIMLDGASKSFEQCYNAQAAVDSAHQIIVAADVTQQCNDKQQLVPMMHKVAEGLGKLATHTTADAGYFSEQALADPTLSTTTLLVPPGRHKHGEPLPDPDGDPETLSAADAMRKRLAQEQGRSIYAMRKATVEPVFGQIKQIRGFRRFSLRGYDNVTLEWLLICATHNLLKMYRATLAKAAATAAGPQPA